MLLGAPGLTTRGKDATRSKGHLTSVNSISGTWGELIQPSDLGAGWAAVGRLISPPSDSRTIEIGKKQVLWPS